MIKFYFLLNLLLFVDTCFIFLCVTMAVNVCIGYFCFHLEKQFVDVHV